MDLTNFKLGFNRAGLLVQKHSPELMLGGGIAGMLISTVLACSATLKAQATTVQVAELDNVLEALNKKGKISDEELEDQKKELVRAYIADLVRFYGPSVILSLASIGMLIGSNRILNSRNVAVLGMFKATDAAFKKYRSRVRDEFGKDLDDYIMYKKKYEGDLKIIDPKKKKNKEVNFDEVDLDGELFDVDEDWGIVPSPYAVFFDDSSVYWSNSPTHVEFFLKSQERFMNDNLKIRGHLFLNEVYDALGVPRTKAGAVVGWVDNGQGDGFVDFDLYNPYNKVNRDFINGYHRRGILIDPNVDGVVYDMI